jgi:glycine/sarcosine N-methyltransferase
MVPTTDDGKKLDITSFYDSLAADYDTMTEIEKRFIVERPFYHLLVGKYKIKKALDAGCGTGFQSLLLTKLGVDVTAVDVSKEMLRILDDHAKHLRMNITTLRRSFLTVPKSFQGSFDAVFCLGNTLPHLLGRNELQKTFHNFVTILKNHGGLVIQILNYHRILAERKEVQSMKQIGDITFVRSYHYDKDKIFFNIEKTEDRKGSVNRVIRTVELRPILMEEIKDVLLLEGFEEFKAYGSMKLESFNPDNSKDLVILARKSAEKTTAE